MLFRALAFATFLASSATADNDSFLRGDRLLAKPGTTFSECFLGNGFPKGKFDYKLNLLGKTKDINYNPQSGNNIVIALSEECKGKNGGDNCSTSAITKIMLYDSASDTCTDEGVGDYGVIDANGVDDGEAGLCLPDPFKDSDEPCIDGTEPSCDEPALYAVYGRVRGKGSLNMELCVTDLDTGADYCPLNPVSLPQKKATDISQQLLTGCITVDGDQVKFGLFDELDVDGDGTDDNVGYFWDVDNKGVRNAELRFYSIATLRESCDDGDQDCLDCYDAVTRAGAVCS